MSGRTSAARQPAPAPRPGTTDGLAGPGGARHPRRAGLRFFVVPPMRADAPRAPFVLLLAVLLVAGLGGLLFLHTALAQDSFRLQDLKNSSAALAAREQALEQQVSVEASPRRLAARAEALGMVRSVNPAFIRLSDGEVLGRPRPGVAPPPPAPTASPTAPTASPTTPAGAEVEPTTSGGPAR